MANPRGARGANTIGDPSVPVNLGQLLFQLLNPDSSESKQALDRKIDQTLRLRLFSTTTSTPPSDAPTTSANTPGPSQPR